MVLILTPSPETKIPFMQPLGIFKYNVKVFKCMRDLPMVMLAIFFRMPMLLEQVEWILKMSPRLANQLK